MGTPDIHRFHERFTRELRAAGILSDEKRREYTVDGISPEIVAMPSNERQVGGVLKIADSLGASVIPWGGGTRIQTGDIVPEYKVAVDLSRIHGIREYEPADQMVIVRAGTTLAQLNEVLAENNQFVPLNPPHPEKATVGGVLASNSSGFLRSRYGTARDMTLGVRFVRVDGRQVKGGGRVAKNVAGYDLTRLMINSWGTLGIITEAALRVQPLPEVSTTYLAGFNGISGVWESADDILNSFVAPTFTMILQGVAPGSAENLDGFSALRNRYVLAVGADGLAETVSWQQDKIREICTKNGGKTPEVLQQEKSDVFRTHVRDIPSAHFMGAVCKIVTTRTGSVRVLDFISGPAAERFPGVGSVTLAASGIVYLLVPITGSVDEPQQDETAGFIEKLRAVADAEGGSCTLEHVPLWLKRKCAVWHHSSGEPLMRRIKKQFDPRNILNPERYIRIHAEGIKKADNPGYG